MIYHGDLFDVLPKLKAESIDSSVTDPPYGIGFMGKKWDSFAPGKETERIVQNQAIDSDNRNLKGRKRSPASSPSAVAYDRGLAGQREFQAWTERWTREVYRVLKPGAYILVCGAPRSFHRMTSGLEDAGFVVRDCFSWLYGQGFPKSLNLGDGRGTALKPSWEPIILARKPLIDTLEVNVHIFGTGALNIDSCRIAAAAGDHFGGGGLNSPDRGFMAGTQNTYQKGTGFRDDTEKGRWPPNVLLDAEAAAQLDEMTGISSSSRVGNRTGKDAGRFGAFSGQDNVTMGHDDSGGTSRFFYTAKPSRAERDEGCYDLKAKSAGEATDRVDGTDGLNSPRAGAGRTGGSKNFHPTVKPVTLMQWLVTLVTPPGGIVLDPFMGSGTTGMAARLADLQFIGVEREAEYVEIARRRISETNALFSGEEEVTCL